MCKILSGFNTLEILRFTQDDTIAVDICVNGQLLYYCLSNKYSCFVIPGLSYRTHVRYLNIFLDSSSLRSVGMTKPYFLFWLV